MHKRVCPTTTGVDLKAASTGSKQTKQLLTEIADLEKRYFSVVERRHVLLNELNKLENEEVELNKTLQTKKSELEIVVNSREDMMATQRRKVRLSGSNRSFSINFKNSPDLSGKEADENLASTPLFITCLKDIDAMKTGVSLRQPHRPRTKPILLENIEPEDASVFSPKNMLNAPKLFDVVSKLLCEDLKVSKFSQVLLSTKKDTIIVGTIEGPNLAEGTPQPPSEKYSDYVVGKTVTTYPLRDSVHQIRDGDPVCDRFYAQLYTNRAIIAIADGCNWGKRPLEAAVKGIKGFVTSIADQQSFTKNLKEIGHTLLRGISSAHNFIIEGKEDVWEAGTTALLGGVLVELKESEESQGFKYAFVCASVGDCKAFLWSQSTGKLIDITVGNRTNLTDAADPGGRLGPYLKGGTPDLRNLDIFFQPCHNGDILLCVTDGVHDNFDPQLLGKTPKDCGIDLDSWSEAETQYPEETEEAKTKFRNELLASMMFHDIAKNEQCTLDVLCSNIVNYCWKLTSPSREFMENNTKKLPSDYNLFPGKMDHTSIIALRVGSYK